MNVDGGSEVAVSSIAAAIGEPARARILYCLMDGRARTSTELAVVAEVSPSTTSAATPTGVSSPSRRIAEAIFVPPTSTPR